MTVRRVLDWISFTGLSTDTKPIGTPGSVFWAYDINTLFQTPDGTNWYPQYSASVVLPTTFDLQQAATAYDLYTATGGPVYVESFAFVLPNVNVSDDVNITSISVVTDTSTVVTLISAAQGAKANLTANAAFAYAIPFTLTVGKKIRIIIAGGAADAPTLCTVSCKYQAMQPVAYLV